MVANPIRGHNEVPRSMGHIIFPVQLTTSRIGNLTRLIHTLAIYVCVTIHHDDNPLLRPTSVQIPTKSYATLQAMASTNIKTVHQTSLLYIESSLDRLGLLSPTHDQRSQQQTGQITFQPVLINKSKFLKATHCKKIRKIEQKIPRSMVV